MKYKNFFLRAVNLLLILGVLWQYQQVALVRAAAVSQRKQEIAEVEAYNASVLQAQSAAQAEQSGYRDGTFMTSRRNVVLPAPLSPMRAMRSPPVTVRSRS